MNKRLVRKQLRENGHDENQIKALLNLYDLKYFTKTYLANREGKPWRPRDYQLDSLETIQSRKVHCDGRDVGKTAEIEIMVLWAAMARHNSEMLIATQCENHLFPLMNRIVRNFERMPQIAEGILEIKRTPSWFIRLNNGFTLWGRIAGPRGINFQGLHVDWQIVDEAQEMSESAWGELYQALNGGGRRWVYGVPNGMRGTFYRMTQSQDAAQFNWPSTLNPEYTPEKDAELVRLYGGRNSSGYIHRVLGQHGVPAHGVFNLDDYLACVDEGIDFENIDLEPDDDFDGPDTVPPGRYYLGCDLGYAHDPSEFVLYRVDGPHLVNVLRMHLSGVNYARQQSIIATLDHAYDFQRIGIDAGNNGRAVAHNLLALGEGWHEKVASIEFGAAIQLEQPLDGAAMKAPLKQFMTDLLRTRLSEHTIVFPNLPERESQYAAHTYTLGHTGRIVYDKGDDHIIDADRCALYAHYLDTGQSGAVPLGVRIGTFD